MNFNCENENEVKQTASIYDLEGSVTQIFAQNGIIMTFVIATTRNLILPADKKVEVE